MTAPDPAPGTTRHLHYSSNINENGESILAQELAQELVMATRHLHYSSKINANEESPSRVLGAFLRLDR